MVHLEERLLGIIRFSDVTLTHICILRYFLIQPTHRKFVRLLRDSLTEGTPIVLNEDDISRLDQGHHNIRRSERLFVVTIR